MSIYEYIHIPRVCLYTLLLKHIMYILTFTFEWVCGIGVVVRLCICDECLRDLSKTRAYLLTSVHIHVAHRTAAFVFTRLCVSIRLQWPTAMPQAT